MPLKLYYPHKPYYISQNWGTINPQYSEHFNNPAFKRHNGIDSVTGKFNWDGSVNTEFPIYCPVENFKVESVTFEPKGGGNQLSLVSKEKVQMFDQQCYARLFLCHAKKILVNVGDEPKLGELLMIGDSTGFSTGLHLHMGLYRLNNQGGKLDVNEATGSFDPWLFFTKQFAVDQASLWTLMKGNLRYYQYLLSLR